jgi:hypothetical protein
VLVLGASTFFVFWRIGIRVRSRQTSLDRREA